MLTEWSLAISFVPFLVFIVTALILRLFATGQFHLLLR